MIQRRIEQTGVELKPAQRLGLTIGVGTIISILDKLGLEQVAKGPGATKIITRIFSKSVNKIPGETQKQAIKRVILELVDKGIITTTKAAAVEIPTEEAQTIIELLAKGYVNEDFEKFDYFQVPTSKEDWREVLEETAILSAIAAGGISSAQSVYNGIKVTQSINDDLNLKAKDFKKIFILRDDKFYNQYINNLEVQKQKEIDNANGDQGVIQEINNLYDTYKKEITIMHETMKKIDVSQDVKQQEEIYNLENEKRVLLEKKKNNDLGVIQTNEINERIKEIDQELLDIAKVKVESEQSKTIEENIKKQKENRKDKVILDFETSLEAVQAAKEAGLISEDAEALQTENGDRTIAVIGKATKGPNKGETVVIYDKEYSKIRGKDVVPHEGDHFMVQDLEEEYGPEVTFALANEIVEAIEDGSLIVPEEYNNLIEKYKEAGFKDKGLADEMIANLGDFLQSGKAKLDQSVLSDLKDAVSNKVKSLIGFELDLGNKNSFIKFLQNRRKKGDDTTPKIKKDTIDTKSKDTFVKKQDTKKPKKTKPSESVFKELKPKETVEKEEPVLYSIDSSTDLEAEIKKIVEKNKKLLENKPPNWRDRAAANTVKSKELRKLLELSKENEKQISIIKDPNSSESQVERAKNRLVENNMPGITDIIKKNFDSRKGTSVTYDDFKAEVLAAFSDLINTYDIESGVPFGAYVFGKMKNNSRNRFWVGGQK